MCLNFYIREKLRHDSIKIWISAVEINFNDVTMVTKSIPKESPCKHDTGFLTTATLL